jgi:hypothetical protein
MDTTPPYFSRAGQARLPWRMILAAPPSPVYAPE